MNAQQIANAIVNGTFTADEMNSIVQAIKYNRSQATRRNANRLCRGDTVQFRNRRGSMSQGTVQDIKIKNVIVLANGLRWKVPANLLEFVSRPQVAA